MSKGLTPGATFPDFELPDDTGAMRRLSELQGDDALVLMLGRGEHCPRERQHQHEMLRFQEWAPVAFTQLVTVLPNDLHDTNKMRIATGAWWTFLSDGDLEAQTALGIRETAAGKSRPAASSALSPYLHAAAPGGKAGPIDCVCLPSFAGPAVFARI